MPVLANSGGGLGAGLLAFGNNYLGARRQKRQDDLFEEQLANTKYQAATQRVTNKANGLHILAPGELPPPDVARNMVDYAAQKGNAATPDNIINSSLSFSPQGGAPTLSRAGAGKANIPGQSGSFMDRLSGMLGQQPDRGAQYQVGKGYYIDRAPQFAKEDAAREGMQGEKLFEAQLAQSMADQNASRDTRKAIDIAAGTAPIDVQKAIATERGVGPLRTQQAIDTSHGTLDDRLALARDSARINAFYRDSQPSYTPFQGTDLTGKPVVRPFNTKTGQFGPVADVAPKLAPSGGMNGGMGAGGIGGLARTSSAITGMGVAHDQMVPYEKAIANGTAKYDGLDYFKGLYSKMYGAEGVVDKAAHSAAFAQLDKTNPQLANYLRSAETWALEDSQLSGKASDFRTKMDNFVSEIGPNFSPDLIANTQRFRQTRLDELRKFQPAMQSMADRFTAGRGGAASTKPPGDKGGDIDLRSDTTSSNPFMSLPKRKP